MYFVHLNICFVKKFGDFLMTVEQWLGEGNTLGIDIWNKKYRQNSESFDQWLDRVSGGNDDVREIIKEKKFLFGGRILANRGMNKLGRKITYSNCFSGDTEIETSAGVRRLDELVDEDIEVFSFRAWRKATVKCFGVQNILKLILTNGKIDKEFHVTGNHLWYIGSLDDYELIETKSLTPGDPIPVDFHDSYSDPDWNSWIVKSVTPTNIEELVYCVVEPEKNAFTLKGGILTHNCYVVAPPEDNLESIFDCAKKLARTYSTGGGCGTDLSKLSPKGAKINNSAGQTSGAVSFMDLYSLVTGLISQGQRRGALMLSLSCTHPDLLDFIHVKDDLNRVTKANISIRVTKEFMDAVKNKQKFKLSFTREETGEVIEKEIDAYSVFKEIAHGNWNMGEPGILFWDRIENYNLLSTTPNFKFAGVNP